MIKCKYSKPFTDLISGDRLVHCTNVKMLKAAGYMVECDGSKEKCPVRKEEEK